MSTIEIECEMISIKAQRRTHKAKRTNFRNTLRLKWWKSWFREKYLINLFVEKNQKSYLKASKGYKLTSLSVGLWGNHFYVEIESNWDGRHGWMSTKHIKISISEGLNGDLVKVAKKIWEEEEKEFLEFSSLPYYHELELKKQKMRFDYEN